MMRLLPTAGLALLIALLAACPKQQAAAPDPVSPAVNNSVAGSNGSGGPPAGFVGEPEVKPLAQSPLNLGGVSLGVSPDLHSSRYQGLEVELEQEWREEGHTGIQWRSFADEEGPAEENSYYNEGRLVAFQRRQAADEQGFSERVELLRAKYGEPLDSAPEFLARSVAYEDFTTGEPDRVVFWADEPTQTVIAGRYDADISSAAWMLFNPQQLVAARADVMSALGS